MGSEAPRGWRSTTLGEVLELKRGYDLPARERVPGSVPIVSSSGPSGWHNEAKVEAPGVVMGRYGTIGEVFLVRQQFWPLNTTLYVRDFKGSDPMFVSYFLKTVRWSNYVDKAAVPGINRNHVHLEPVIVPPLDEQRRIAAVLGALDDKIELNRKMNQTLEAMAQALFKSWFIDFDGHDPADLVDSELGPIPKGWAVKPLLEVLELFSGGTPKRGVESFWHGSIEWASAADITRRTSAYILSTSETITEEGCSRSPAKLRPAETTVITARGTVGEVAILSREMAFNQTCYGLFPKNRRWTKLTYFLIKSKVVDLQKQAYGAIFDTITTRNLRDISVPWPPDNQGDELESILAALLDRVLMSSQESDTLATLRDALLPKLISGELRVPEAEAVVEDLR